MSNPTNPAFTGPGTQPMEEDGSVLEYMEMPEGMMTFARPIIPEPEEAAGPSVSRLRRSTTPPRAGKRFTPLPLRAG